MGHAGALCTADRIGVWFGVVLSDRICQTRVTTKSETQPLPNTLKFGAESSHVAAASTGCKSPQVATHLATGEAASCRNRQILKKAIESVALWQHFGGSLAKRSYRGCPDPTLARLA